MYIRLDLSSQRSDCLCLLNAGVKGVRHPNQLYFVYFVQYWGSNPTSCCAKSLLHHRTHPAPDLPFKTEFCCVAHAGLELTILLPRLPKLWGYHLSQSYHIWPSSFLSWICWPFKFSFVIFRSSFPQHPPFPSLFLFVYVHMYMCVFMYAWTVCAGASVEEHSCVWRRKDNLSYHSSVAKYLVSFFLLKKLKIMYITCVHT